MTDGRLRREIVLGVLRDGGVEVSKKPDGRSKMYTLAKGDIVLSMSLPDFITRRMVHYLSRKFGIYIHAFYRASP